MERVGLQSLGSRVPEILSRGWSGLSIKVSHPSCLTSVRHVGDGPSRHKMVLSKVRDSKPDREERLGVAPFLALTAALNRVFHMSATSRTRPCGGVCHVWVEKW